MESAVSASGSQQAPVKIYNAVYSSVQVYECMIRGIAVMRRRADAYVNATQILKVAGVDKGRRTKILEKDVLTSKHEIVQGGYGKYQGTWIPLEKGREIANQFGVAPLLAPLFDFTPSTNSLQALPVSTPLINALSTMPNRPLSASSSFPNFPSPSFPRSPQNPSPGREGSVPPGPNPLAPPPIMPGSALRLLNQGRAQGLFTPSTSITHGSSLQLPGPLSPRPASAGASPTPPPIPSTSISPAPVVANNTFPSQPQSTVGKGLKRHHSEADMDTDVSMPDCYDMGVVDSGPSPAKRPRTETSTTSTSQDTLISPAVSNGARAPSPASQAMYFASTVRPDPTSSTATPKSTFLSIPSSTMPSSPLDLRPHTSRFSTKVSPIYTRDPAPLKDSRRTAIFNMICQSDDAAPILEALKGAGNAGLTYVSPNAEDTFDPDTPLDPSYHTALHMAASLSRINTVSILLSNGADAHKGNHLGETPLIRTILSSNSAELQSMPSILSLIGSTIWTLDAGGRSVLHHICAVAGVKDRAQIARYYLDAIFTYIATKYSGDYKSIVDIQDEHGDTALLVAARVGHRGIVRCFLDVGANITLVNKLGLRAGDFGVAVEELNVGLPHERLTVLRPAVPAPVQKSQDVIADMTEMIQNLSTEFQAEIKTKQDALDVTQAHLRAATRELSEQRRQIQLWQQRLGELDQAVSRAKNIEKAIRYEDTMDWTGRVQPKIPGENADKTILHNLNKDPSVLCPSAFAYRGSKTVLGKDIDLSAAQPLSPPMESTPAALIKLRRMKLWCTRIDEMVHKRLQSMEGNNAEREFLCRKIVAICTGTPVQDVDSRLDVLIKALEVDDVLDVSRIRGFMQKVQP